MSKKSLKAVLLLFLFLLLSAAAVAGIVIALGAMLEPVREKLNKAYAVMMHEVIQAKGVERAKPTGRLEPRFISSDWLCLAGDYTDFINERILTEQKLLLSPLSDPANAQYHNARPFNYAAYEVIKSYRPEIVKEWSKSDFFQIKEKSTGKLLEIDKYNSWLNAIGQFRIRQDGHEKMVPLPAVAHFAYIRFKTPMKNGVEYLVTNRYGDTTSFVYDDKVSISRAIKANQVGYHPNAGKKYAYLNMWLGPMYSLYVEAYEGKPFYLISEADGKTAFTGVIRFRSKEQYHRISDIAIPVNGGSVMDMEFSGFNTPGRYHIQIPGVGRSWSFEIGNGAIGQAFYTHTRGLYHARCGTEKTQPYTKWESGSCHTVTRQGGFSPDWNDYSNGSERDCGYFNNHGHKMAINWFKVVANSATDQILPGVSGGWHDAADFDRRPFHLRAVGALVGMYMMFPDHFTDGQLNLPESGNGIPDVLDEAIWGMEVWRKAQKSNGGVGTWIEATSHPENWHPETDTQKYYLSVATRDSSLEYAATASLLARALKKIGKTELSKLYQHSAEKAFAFAVDPSVIISWQTSDWTFRGNKKIDKALLFKAALNLDVLTGSLKEYGKYLTKENFKEFDKVVPYPRGAFFYGGLLDPEIERNHFEFVREIRRKMRITADHSLKDMDRHAFRTTQYPPEHPFFRNMGWGNANPLRYAQTLLTAYYFLGDKKYLDAAYLANDFLMGANPMGRCMTTGLGYNYPVRILHLPMYTHNWTEPPPGITPFTFFFRITPNALKMLYVLDLKKRTDNVPENIYRNLIPQLPPEAGPEQVQTFLRNNYPAWHRTDQLESYSVELSEFSVWETIADSAVGTGALLSPGWMPSEDLKQRGPVKDVTSLPGYLVQP